MKTKKMFLPIAAFGMLIVVISHTPKEENMTVVEHMKMPKVNLRSVVPSSANKVFVKRCQE